MRSCLLHSEGRSCLFSRVVLAFCLAAALFVTPVVSASSTHCEDDLGSHQTHCTPRTPGLLAGGPSSGAWKSSGKTEPGTIAEAGLTLAATDLSVTLDQVHSHPAMVSDTAPQADSPLPALATSTTGTDAASTANSAVSPNMPLFNTSVPSYMPVALRGSHEVLVHQNIIADVEGLSRIQDDAQLSAMVRSGDLVALPASPGLAVDPRLPLNRRYTRPWTAQFLRNLARAHEDLFGRPLQLTSAVRTVNFQRHLAHYNGNAAPTSGDTASPHLTGRSDRSWKKGNVAERNCVDASRIRRASSQRQTRCRGRVRTGLLPHLCV